MGAVLKVVQDDGGRWRWTCDEGNHRFHSTRDYESRDAAIHGAQTAFPDAEIAAIGVPVRKHAVAPRWSSMLGRVLLLLLLAMYARNRLRA